MERILLIEDDKNIRTVIALHLGIRGYHVEVAEDGEEGIALFTRSGNFDLVITDIRMPKKDGNDVAKYIRKSGRAQTPIVAITAYKNQVQTDLFDFTLIKPFRNEDLIRIIISFEHTHSGETVQGHEGIQQATPGFFRIAEKDE